MNAYNNSSDPKIIACYYAEVVENCRALRGLSDQTKVQRTPMLEICSDFYAEKGRVPFKERKAL